MATSSGMYVYLTAFSFLANQVIASSKHNHRLFWYRDGEDIRRFWCDTFDVHRRKLLGCIVIIPDQPTISFCGSIIDHWSIKSLVFTHLHRQSVRSHSTADSFASYKSRFTLLKNNDSSTNLDPHSGFLVLYDDYYVYPDYSPTDIPCTTKDPHERWLPKIHSNLFTNQNHC